MFGEVAFRTHYPNLRILTFDSNSLTLLDEKVIMDTTTARKTTTAPVNLTGNWIYDANRSDSLQSLIDYHGGAVTPFAILGRHALRAMTAQAPTETIAPPEAPTSASSVSSALGSVTSVREASDETGSSPGSQNNSPAGAAVPPIVPALIVQHSTRRLTTYLHNLIPRYSDTGTLLRYDPEQVDSKLAIHEDYRLDAEYRPLVNPQNQLQARAYMAPHLQSLLVDTRCASKYDLERTERFLEDDGRTLVIEVRVLSCAPAQAPQPGTLGVSKRFLADPPRTPDSHLLDQQLKVREVIFLKVVFKRILDAAPAGAQTGATATSGQAASAVASTASSLSSSTLR